MQYKDILTKKVVEDVHVSHAPQTQGGVPPTLVGRDVGVCPAFLQHARCHTDFSLLCYCNHAGSEQHAFMIKDLASVNRTLTPWLVVGGHRPFYIDSTNNLEPDGDQPVARALRDALEDAFYKYQVFAACRQS